MDASRIFSHDLNILYPYNTPNNLPKSYITIIFMLHIMLTKAEHDDPSSQLMLVEM